jgi:TetR/AcrR family transcriptional regulator
MSSSSPRRAPKAGERQRDAERTRERILDAATREFSARGYAGARVASIAARAGVNQQLISYYFGGKQGLFDALTQRWLAREAVFADPARPIDDVIAGYFDASDPESARLLLWQALGDVPQPEDEAAQRGDIEASLEDLRRRQKAGELTTGYDAEFILVVSWAAIMAKVALPDVVRLAYGDDPGVFRERFLPQLQRLFKSRGDSVGP